MSTYALCDPYLQPGVIASSAGEKYRNVLTGEVWMWGGARWRQSESPSASVGSDGEA